MPTSATDTPGVPADLQAVLFDMDGTLVDTEGLWHQAVEAEIREGMVLAIEPGCYWPEGGGLRVEDNFLVTASGPEKLSPFPDGIVNV